MTFTLTTQAVNGTIILSPSGGNYLSGSSVIVTATPDAGYQFIGWSGALTGNEISPTLVMDGNKSVTANFSSTADPFTAWASAGMNFADDANNDSVAEGMAWFLGADQPNSSATVRLPKATNNSTGLVLEFECLSGADRGTAVFEVQFSTHLDQAAAWTGTPIPGTTGTFTAGVVDFVVNDPEPTGGLLRVVATIPAAEAASGRFFGRIKGVKSSSP